MTGNIVIGAGGAKSTSDPSYVPPPHGGGACISHRDCFPTFPTSKHNHHTGGLCKEGACDCLGDYTGSYCQVNMSAANEVCFNIIDLLYPACLLSVHFL